MKHCLVPSFIAALFFLASCDECDKSSDCSTGEACVDGKCQASSQGEDTDTESDTGTSRIWCDSASGLCWQNPPDDPWKTVGAAGWTWQGAIDYCKDLSHEGSDDWRSPKIDELRTLIEPGEGAAAPEMPRCSENLPGSACEMSDPGCLTGACVDECGECMSEEGPGEGGCYWDPTLKGTCGLYRSSSGREDLEDQAWGVTFTRGMISSSGRIDLENVRCVRTGP